MSSDIIESAVSEIVNANSLKAMVMEAIFCQLCQNILDVRRAVELDVVDPKHERVIFAKVLCVSCWAGDNAHIFKVKVESRGFRIDVLDGRELFKEEPEMKEPPPDAPEGAPSMEQLQQEFRDEGPYTATDDCEIYEADGQCEHGCPSWMSELGFV